MTDIANDSAGSAELTQLGEYQILEKLGAGGMGAVYKARHSRMDRVVALKVMSKAALDSHEAVQRFLREVKASARLNHPNIVTSYDAGEQDGIHYLVMEYVVGIDLDELVCRHKPIKAARAVEYIIQAARGLEYAHKQGVVHRDIKPANLILDEEGTVKILDMGLARLHRDKAAETAEKQSDPTVAEGLTQTHTVMGTAAYMAPEQATRLKDTDARADIYSLGCTLHFLVTGRDPYYGESFIEMVLAHRDEPIPSLVSYDPAIPPALDAVFQRMLAKSAQDRYQSMTEVIQELEAAMVKPAPQSKQAAAQSVSPTADLQPFVEAVTRLGLMTQAEVGEFLASIPPQKRPQTAEQMADALARAERLSGYQAAILVRGNPDDLLFDDYLLVDKIAAGSHAELYLAQHRTERFWAALKVLDRRFAPNEGVLKKFMQDIGRVSQLPHENLTRIFHAGAKNGRPYVVSEFVEAHDLASHVKHYGPLPFDAAVSYLWQAGDALAAAGQQGIHHLNLKPSQLLVTEEGHVKVTDLGLGSLAHPAMLAKQNDSGHEGVTRSEIMPEVDFIAPEQITNPQGADVRADIYGLGCILYYLLTGFPLFRRGTAQQTLRAHQQDPIPTISDYAENVPHGAQLVLYKAVAKNPENRYASIAEFLEALSTADQVPEPEPQVSVPVEATVSPGASSVQSFSPPEAKKDEKKPDPLPEILTGFALPLAVLFTTILVACMFTQLGTPLPMLFAQAGLGALLATAVWYFRDPIIEFSRSWGFVLGPGFGLMWAIVYFGLDYPYAADIDRFVQRYAMLAGATVPAVMGIVAVGLFFGLAAGLSGERGSFFMGLGLFFPVLAVAIASTNYLTMDAEEARVEAMHFYNRKEYRKAIYYFSRAIDMDSRDVDSRRFRGLCYLRIQSPNQAISDFDVAIDTQPTSELHRHRSQAYEAKGETNKALQDANMAITLDPNDPQNYRRRAEIYEKLGNTAAAEADRAKEASLLRQRLEQIEGGPASTSEDSEASGTR